MVVGNGLIANGFKNFINDEGIVIFASGVSKSTENEEKNFLKELDLLENTIENLKKKTLVYFSTCSLYDTNGVELKYTKHKQYIEKKIEKLQSYYIFRLPQAVGVSNNKEQLLNFLIYSIRNGVNFKLFKNAYRNFIDIDDISTIASYIIKNKLHQNSIINIANAKKISIIEVISKIEKHFSKKGVYEIVDSGSSYEIDISNIKPYLAILDIDFDGSYFENLLEKYYPKDKK